MVFSGFNEGLGNVVIVKNDTGEYSLYGHMQGGDRAAVGQRIWQGDTLGLVGSTGTSTGPHLHYSVIKREAGNKSQRFPGVGGTIGVDLNDTNTVDPAGYDDYDPTPGYQDETMRAARIQAGQFNPTGLSSAEIDRFNGIRRAATGLSDATGTAPAGIDHLYDFTQLGRSSAANGITPLNQTAPTPWYSSPAVTGNYTPTENFSWNNVPTGGFGNRGPSPTKRPPQQDRRSAAPDGLAPTSAQGTLPATPASQAGGAGTGGVLGKFNWDSLITAAAAAMPSAQRAPLLAYFPGPESGIGDGSADAANPDGYPKLRRVSSAFPGITPPDPKQSSPESPSLRGVVSGDPMPLRNTPQPLEELLNNSNPSGNDDGFKDLVGLAWRSSTSAELPQQTAGSMPERSLGRKTYSVSRAFNTGAPAVPFVSSGDADYAGGFAALTRIDPQNPNQLAPLPLDDDEEQPDLRALEAAFSDPGNIRDAVALYKARKSRRR